MLCVRNGWKQMKGNFELRNKMKPLQYFEVCILIIITGILGLLDWLMLREMILSLLSVSSIDPWSWSAIDKFTFVLFGMIWLVVVYLSTYYYKKGAVNKRLWSYFLFITGVEIIILFLTHILPTIVGREQYSIVLMILEAVSGIICIVTSFNVRKR